MTTARREGENVIVTIPLDEVLSLRVALQPCPCRSAKSNSTTQLRERFVKGLGMAAMKRTGTEHQAGVG